jgi:hypothetical protein
VNRDRDPISRLKCYLCGKTARETPEGKLTREHVPPCNFFLNRVRRI